MQPTLKLSEEEFLSLCFRLKGDLTDQHYFVYEDVNIIDEFRFGIRLGNGHFAGAFRVKHSAILRSLDFESAYFAIIPEVSAQAVISTIYNDRNYFAGFTNEELQSDFFLLSPFNFNYLILSLCTTKSKKYQE